MNSFGLTHRHRRRLVIALSVLLACPAGAALAAERPDASFSFSPEDPRANEAVTFTSSSCDPDGNLVRQAWDLDGDGAFDDAEGPIARRVFPNSGANNVGLEVTAEDGETSVRQRTVMVDTEYALPRPDSDRLMTPFPVVRLAGEITGKGARVKILAVRGPICSVVQVRCRGRGCPARPATEFIGKGRLRLRRFERRLRAGAVLTIRVSKNDLIGKFTQFRIRKNLAPKRRDRCLRPGARRGSACPRD